MRKVLQFFAYVLVGLGLTILVYLVAMCLSLITLNVKYDGLSAGLTVQETDWHMGGLFSAQFIDWDDIPVVYTEGYVERSGGVIRNYKFLGLSGLNIIVLFDEGKLSYLHIPCYE